MAKEILRIDKTISTVKKLDELTKLVEAMLLTQQQMYSKIEFLEKRIKLLEEQ